MARAREALAPWGEVVRGAAYPMSIEEFQRLPEDGWHYELVDGRLVRMSPPGGGHASLVTRFTLALGPFVKLHALGELLVGDPGFILSSPAEPTPTELAPDLAFIRSDRLPPRDSKQWDQVWRFAPDLVVEIASPSQSPAELAAKSRLWLRYGVRLVWVAWPRLRKIDVWIPGHDEPLAVLGSGDLLDGRDVVPGFSYPVAEILS